MNLTNKRLNQIKWTARITGSLIFLFVFPFYIGYGVPLPDSSMTIFENLWLIIIPIFLLGCLIGWKWEKIAGYLLTIPIILGFFVALIVWEDPSFIMAFPLIPGFLYLIYGYKR